MKKLRKITALLLTIALCGCSSQGEVPITPNEIGGITVPQQTDSPDDTNSAQGSQTPDSTTGNNGSTAPSENQPDINTDDLYANSSQYEGEIGTGNFNYGEALQKSIIFYELQRSGEVEGTVRSNWKGDSGLTDGSDNGVDLVGGLYDAGDNVKFNLPMAYTGTILAWSVFEDYESYEKSGQLEYQLNNLRWINDYLMKCHTAENEFYYQVGDGNADHAWWGPAEVMQMNRPSYKVTASNPGSCVVAGAAASLAAAAAVFMESDTAYASECLKHAKELYNFAETTQSDAGYTAANGFYNSWSGFNDELAFAATWLYTVTNDELYLQKARKYYDLTGRDYKWTMCWDDVTLGAALRLSQITGENKFKEYLETNLDWWCNGIQYTPDGLAWLDSWGSLRYATTAAFLASVYSESGVCPEGKIQKYWDFALSQVDYALGSTGRSFVCGFGVNYPVNPHHRTAQGSYCDNMNEPSVARHTLYGALVGGPNASGSYNDTVSDYTANEVACDYNAGFTGALAKMYKRYGGQTLVNFGAVEKPTCDEIYVDACVNASGSDFTEIKAVVYNVSAWPARVADDLELRYYIDLSEGVSAENLTVSMNYNQGGQVGGVMTWDEEKNLYYVSIDFSGTKIYPGGQDAHKKEVQFRINANGGAWDATNDPSYACIANGSQGSLTRGTTLAVYEGGKLVYGTEPDGEGIITEVVPSVTTPTQNNSGGSSSSNGGSGATSSVVTQSASNGDLSVKLGSSDLSSAQNLNVSLEITNTSSKAISISSLEIKYYFTKDGSADLAMTCDHTAIQNGDAYVPLSAVSGSFSSASGNNADTLLTIKSSDNAVLEAGGVWKIQARVNKSDWSMFNPANDFSALSAENIAIYSNGSLIFGKTP